MIKKKHIIVTLLLLIGLGIFQCGKQEMISDGPFGDKPTLEEIQARHIKWQVISNKISEDEYEVIVHSWLQDKWHLYSQELSWKEGPLETIVTFETGNDFSLVGKAEEEGVEKHYDPVWEHDIEFFADEVFFKQKVKVINPGSMIFSGNVNFMMCDDRECMPPDDFSFKINLATGEEIKTDVDVTATDDKALSLIPAVPNVDLENPVNPCGDKKDEENKTYWMLFILGLGGGLISLITPCVFPMIPLTVSFFTKGGKEKGKGIWRAIIYGVSIVAVYAALSLPFYAPGTDPEMLNQIATGFTLNMFFFVIFVVFAISFFGYFEITLPNSWANKADKASDVGGLMGIIFMALVLAIVSFSCTGPLLGSVLAGSLKDGPLPITIAMLGFGAGLGIPFTLFAAFPSLLKSLPQSGGWLNTVKVVLGFVELGLAVKFLSNADFVYRFGVLHRETFFLIWAILAFATAAYLFGLFLFPHDSKGQKIGSTRKVIGVIFLIFGIYVAPGVMPKDSQPWNFGLVSGFPPSTWYSWYDQEEELEVVTDFQTALDLGAEQDKLVLLDFTGYACVNCRKMEDNVWTEDDIHKVLDENFVIASLYVDDKVSLDEDKKGDIVIPLSDGTNKLKKIKTVGDIWATFESLRFKQVSQPYYVLMSPDGHLMTNPVAYTPDSDEYLEWLKCGMDAYEKYKSQTSEK
ncbi:MAG: thiol:disulfide interchange protein [Patiriisocius sp.]|jgi:thiol:disulfide interchange protein